MPATDLSPNVDNYFVGAGIVKWKGTADSDYRDVGNVSKFEFTSNVTRLKHYSSRQGIRRKDKDVVTQVDATVALTMEEVTAQNLALMLMAIDAGGVAPIMLDIGADVEMEGALRLVGTNDVGARVQLDLPSCIITPSAALGLINQGTWGEIQLTAEVNADTTTGQFGRLAWGITTEIAYP